MAWSIETEEAAIQNARAGDQHAFQLLYENYGPYVYRSCLRLIGDPATAEDLRQDVFVQVWKRISTFRGRSKFKTWLHRVVTNMVYMHLRKKQRRPAVESYTPPPGDDRTLEERLPAHPSDLDDRLLLCQTISVLAPKYRAVLILHDVDGYEHEEIARILDIPSGTSKSTLSRARRQIRTVLQRRRRLLLNVRKKAA
jgi:RNA polymerase sigma-70 factor (ECF subfamily)